MKIKFWGVRGSIPSPVTPQEYRSKLTAIIQRIQPDDLLSQDSRELFIAALPEYLSSAIGGNTTCIQVTGSAGDSLIIDAGSGIRELAHHLDITGLASGIFHILLSHFHWDHIQGLPFFAPYLYQDGSRFHFYHTDPKFPEYLRTLMKTPFFPTPLPESGSRLQYHILPESSVRIGPFMVTHRAMKHPGGCIAYRIEENGKAFIFSTDTELVETDFNRTEDNIAFFQKCDLLIMDSQYTLNEAIEKFNWGHSSYSLAVEFAAAWEVPRLALFHHDPLNSDKKLYSMVKSAREYSRRSKSSLREIFSAREGLEVII